MTHSIGGPDGDLFTIDQRSGQISVGSGTKSRLRGEKNNYEVTVTATDPSGASTSTTVNIIVTNVNEKPTITITPGGGVPPSEGMVGGLDAVSVVEDTSTVGTYTTTIENPSWNLSGPDSGDFDISSGGVLSFSSPPDYENPVDGNRDNVYMVTVVASNGGATSATLAVTVTVTNNPADDPTNGGFDPNMYDENNDGTIDRDEVLNAIDDYFEQEITKDQVLDVIDLYFS